MLNGKNFFSISYNAFYTFFFLDIRPQTKSGMQLYSFTENINNGVYNMLNVAIIWNQVNIHLLIIAYY